MISQQQIQAARQRSVQYLERAGIRITPAEAENIEVAELGLGKLEDTGLQILIYINNERYCAKELILFPYQTCPEHRHPPCADDPGKMETFRCRWGKVYLYVEGPPTRPIQARIPAGDEAVYTVFREIVLEPGDQFTIPSGMKHWFQAGDEGAVVSEFSSTSRDEADIFTDPRIQRVPESDPS